MAKPKTFEEVELSDSLKRSVKELAEHFKATNDTIDRSVDLMGAMEARAKTLGTSLSRIGDNMRENEIYLKKVKNLEDALYKAIENEVYLTEKKLDLESKRAEILKKIADAKAKGLSVDKKLSSEYKLLSAELTNINKALLEAPKSVESLNKKLKSTESFWKNISANLENSFMENLSRITNISERNLNKAFSKIGITLSGPMKVGILGFIVLLAEAFKLFNQFDAAATNFRKTFGLLRSDAGDYESTIHSVAKEFAGMGVTIEGALKSITAVTETFGRLSSVGKDVVANVALFSQQLGVSEKNSTGLLKSLSEMSGKPIATVTRGAMGFAQSLSSAAGTNLNEVMSDIANMSDTVRMNFRGSGIELIKATVEARRMGLSLESMAKTSDSLLDFNNSINKEMEASVLLNKNVNFLKARQLAFRGDMVGANKEILNVVKSVGDFNKLLPMQQKALADAAGKTVGELQTMIQKEEEMEYIRNSGSDAAKAMLADYEKQAAYEKALASNAGLRVQKQLEERNQQEKINALKAQWNKLLINSIEPMTKLITPIVDLAVEWLPTVVDSLISVVKFIWSAADKIVLMSAAIGKFAHLLRQSHLIALGLFRGLAPAKSILDKIFLNVRKISIFASKSLSIFGKWLNPIGWIFMAFQFISNLSARLGKLFGEGGTILQVFGNFAAAIYDTIAKPFYEIGEWISKKFNIAEAISDGLSKSDIAMSLIGIFDNVWMWLKKTFIGNSPSELGLGIVRGLVSVGEMIFSALISPFKKGLDFILKLPGFGMVAKAMEKVTGGTLSVNSTSSTPATISNTTTDATNKQIIDKLDELIGLMKSGGIAVNLDGRKVSQGLAIASSY